MLSFDLKTEIFYLNIDNTFNFKIQCNIIVIILKLVYVFTNIT